MNDHYQDTIEKHNTEPPKEEKSAPLDLKSGESRKKKKKSPLLLVAVLLLTGVMCFSGYKIISQLLEYKRGQDSYNDLREQVVGSWDAQDTPATISTTPWTVPAQEPTMDPSAMALVTTNADRDDSRATRDPISRTENERGDITYDPNETFARTPGVIPRWKIDFAALKSRNGDVKAWLYGMDGIVNYPVVQGRDNDYYLHRLLDGTQQFCGTLFVDYRNDFLKDDVSYIFGHKMKDGTMFGHFGRYDTYDYYQSHPIFRLFTPEGTYDLQVITCVYTTDREPLVRNLESEEAFNQYIANIRARGNFQTAVEVSYGDHLVSLFTCAYYRENGRMFVICKAVQIEE